MKLRRWPKILFSPKKFFPDRKRQDLRPGILPLSLVFSFFLLVAISTILLTQFHLRLSGLRRELALAGYAAENGLKMSYLFLWEKIQSSSWPLILSDTEWETIKKDEEAARWLFSRVMSLEFPLYFQSNWKNMSWKTVASLQLEEIVRSEAYLLQTFSIILLSEGQIIPFSRRATSRLLIQTTLASGFLPLSLFPLLLEKDLPAGEQSAYLEAKRTTLSQAAGTSPAIRPFFSPAGMISRDIHPFLEKALKIRLFQPDRINPLILREALGLEKSPEAVPDGVYLVHDDLGVGGVYVQGDLDELLLAMDETYQVVLFRKEERTWELRFNPGIVQTIFATPEGNFFYNQLPNGIILVNGNIHSLGGGKMTLGGKIIPCTDNSEPSLLPGARLSIVSSGVVNISSDILQPGLEITPGIPYIRKRQTQVVIFSAGKDLLTSEERDGGINLVVQGPEGITVEAELVALGQGFRVEGVGRRVEIRGSLQTTEIDNSSSAIRIIPENFTPVQPEADLLPLTSRPLTGLIIWKPIEWRDNETSSR